MHHHQFAEQGYVGPFRALSPGECRDFLRRAESPQTPPPLDWPKGHAANARVFYDIATTPAILDVVRAVLGPDVMLWGAQILTRGPGAVHPWHSDIEPSHAPPLKTVTVWIGLEHTTRESALLLVPRSHTFGRTVQEVVRAAGVRREAATTQQIETWARERDLAAEVVTPDLTDGMAIFFEGHLWHHSNNVSAHARRALLLQYATPDVPMRIPDLNYLTWPFRHFDVPRPACVMVSGTDTAGVNRIVAAPVANQPASEGTLSSLIYPVGVPLALRDAEPWSPYPIFKGSTAGVRKWWCHASALAPQHCPHPPHRHDEEELLLVMDGEVQLELPESGWRDDDPRLRLTRGDFVFYPPQFPHTLRTTGDAPASYLMFKWRDGARTTASELAFGRFTTGSDDAAGPMPPEGRRRKLFSGATANLGALTSHVSTLAAGAGYEPHADAYDVAIITLEGEVETLGMRVPPHSVIFYPAGAPHGMRNVGPAPARYVVFEFHRRASRAIPARPPLAVRLADPRRWKRRLQHMLARA